MVLHAPEELGLSTLFLDLNSYFASVEQNENPALRGKPVAVVPMMTDSTCAIAASYEAKAYGIKTGTKIYDAKQMCPNLICVLARHDAYVVEDGDHRGEEDNDRQHVEREDEAQLELGQVAEQEGNPLLAVADHAADALADAVEHALTGRQPEHQGGEEDLQTEGETHCSQRDTTTIIRAECG